MKLLLTSSGISNKKITKALKDLLNKPFPKSSIVYITTASNLVVGDKSWLIKDLVNFKNLGFKSLDILDISAVPQKNWQPRLESADVLVFGGGDEFYLMHWVVKSGLKKILPKLIKEKVYVGISAGSMITTKKLSYALTEKIFEEKVDDKIYKNIGLGYIDFQICPHYKSKSFKKNTKNKVSELTKEIKEEIYAIDDNTAIKIDGDKIEIVSSGFWEKFN